MMVFAQMAPEDATLEGDERQAEREREVTRVGVSKNAKMEYHERAGRRSEEDEGGGGHLSTHAGTPIPDVVESPQR